MSDFAVGCFIGAAVMFVIWVVADCIIHRKWKGD